MKVLLTAMALLIAQFVNCQIYFAASAGPQATGVHYIVDHKKQETSMKLGVNAGLQVKIPLEGRLYFAPSIMYNLRGYKVKYNAPPDMPNPEAVDNNTSFHTIELGFLLQHDFKMAPGHFFIRFGPSLDFALFGNEKYNTQNNGLVERAMPFNFASYGHYLASAIVHFGYEFKNKWYVYGHYNYSIGTMSNVDYGDYIGNRAAGISIGYYFKTSKVVL
jgi:hypothetical protein